MKTVSASWTTTPWYERKRLVPTFLRHLSSQLSGMVPFLTSAPAVLSYSLDRTYRHQDFTLQIIDTSGFSLPHKGSLCLKETGMEFSLNSIGSFPQQVHITYPYSSVTTFGGCKDDFMLVIRSIPDQSSGKTHIDKLIFKMPAPKVGLTASITIYSGLV